ncbi:putative late blight resistance protein -like r1b-16 [Nicotiana attenuata]|uniref:Late blight resistance protein -like r1b-16 n=1 Tax=Nicotiana attenuata TaxID=49451 RepID=A0A1J6J4X2_NICAT|nr:putative late blight resistance protein -like r1b-16 [Nicotiana attenuata]
MICGMFKAWEDLRLSFPNDENTSRIIVTTRLEVVGKQVKYHTDPYSLPFLTTDESLKLLQKKVFQKEIPHELQNVSLAVAKRCKGLPLVIILVAGIIKKKKMEESWWHEVKNSLLSYLGESEEYSLSTMQLSYDTLPDHLRPCLLYMGMFPEDARIPVSRLISLWIAENFVQNPESGRLEEAAEGYLMDLISSNVVMVSRRGYKGKVKYCQVHDLVLHFCLERSRQEKFMLAVNGHHSHFQPSDWKENRVSFNFTNELSEIALVVSKIGKPFHPQLRVRALSTATLHPIICLKYLAVDTVKFVFNPESHLRHLETIIVECGYVLLPGIFWKMEKLRHVDIAGSFDFKNNKQRIYEESCKFENLRILRHVIFPIDDVDSMDMLLQRCPNLQEVNIVIFNEDDSTEICTSSPKLESLSQLQSLSLCFIGSIILSDLDLPSNLEKLELYGGHIVSVASLIAGLPSLEYLLLTDWNNYSGEWCLGDITFNKLKFLKLRYLGISKWDASDESFPQLEKLVIKSCDKLEEIPISIAYIQTLKQIKVMWCDNESLEASAVKIKEEAEVIEGCSRIDLIIRVSRNKLICAVLSINVCLMCNNIVFNTELTGISLGA